MSVFSTRDLHPDNARNILSSHLLEALMKIPLATDEELDDMMNTYVSGNGIYKFDNFAVHESYSKF